MMRFPFWHKTMSRPRSEASTRRLRIANLLAQIVFGLLAMTICLPSMQEWGRIFDADQGTVQLSFSGYVVAYGLLQPLYGQLSDRRGRKRLLLLGLSVSLLASLLAASAPDLTTLIVARILQGAGGAAGVVIARSMVQDMFSGPERTRVMAYIGMAMGLCPPLGTVVGGQIHVRLGWQFNFLLIAALAACLLVAAWRGFAADARPADGDAGWLRALLSAYGRLARDRSFLLYLVILSMTTSAFYAFLAGAPLVLRSYGVGPDGVGWYIMFVPLSYMFGNFLTSRLIHRAGERRMMALGQTSALAGLTLMLALGLAKVDTPLAFAVPLILFGIGHGFLMPPALAGSVGLVPALAGSAAGAAGLMQQGVGAAAGFSVGLFAHDGPVNLGLLMIGLTLSAVSAQWLLHRRRRPARPA